MKSKHKVLFAPITIGKVQIKNRFAMAPMATAHVDDFYAYEQESIDYFTERARGGTGLIITGANFVENNIEKHMKASFPCPTVDPARYMQRLKKMTDQVHAYGSKLFVQLTAGLGRSAIPEMILDKTFVAPSETTNRWNPDIKHRALTTQEVYELIKQFATSAFLAKMGGADGIEVHAVHEGYLLDCFTMEFFNQRTDEFGGDLMARLRFPLAILKAVKQACGEDFPVILRFSLKSFIKSERRGILPGEEKDYKEMGRDIEEGLKIAKIFTDAGYDALNVDAGSYDAWYWAHPPFFFERGLYREFARQVKQVVSKPVMCAGRLGYPDLAAEAIESGDTDMVVLGRPLLADPEFVNKLHREQEEDIRPCLSCHDGCFNRAHHLQQQSCAVNPQCNREREAAFGKVDTAKRCVVVGAGPAGMEAARVLALRGHDVSLYEKADHAGGLYFDATTPTFKQDGRLLIKWYERQLAKLGVKINYSTEVKATDDVLKGADIVVTATGSRAFIPHVSGIEHAISAVDAMRKLPEGDAVIIGAGQVGCELGIWLSQNGVKVTLVDMADKLMALNEPAAMNKLMIEELLLHYNVATELGETLCEIKPGCAVTQKDGKPYEIPARNVILALGYRSDHTLYDALIQSGAEAYNLGDSRQPQDIMTGIWDAYELCSHI